jgi:hypothetical protein
MSYCRFVQLKQYLYLSNNETYNPENHPNPIIWPIFKNKENKSVELHTPKRDITIDGILLHFMEDFTGYSMSH